MVRATTKLKLTNCEVDEYKGEISGNQPAISYRAIIGLEADSWGLCISETRARLIDGRYLLEKTEDSRPLSGCESRDGRNFSILVTKGIAETRKEARHFLEYTIRRYAKSIAIDCGLEIADLISSKNERNSK